jgi:hypothetical protein
MRSKSLHSQTFAANLEKISQQIKYLPFSQNQKLNLKYYLASRQFRQELKRRKANGAPASALDTVNNHWSYERRLMHEERQLFITRKYLRKANRLLVPVPGYDSDPLSLSYTSKSWGRTENYDFYLTDEGLATVREEIEKERKRRRESRAHWVQLISALTGLIGTIAGLFAVLNK